MTKRILITGASSGIGWATAKQFISQGDEVIGLARNFDRADQKYDGLIKLSLDLSDVEQLPNKLTTTDLLNQELDVLILNAGYGRFGGIEQFSTSQIQHLMNTNLTSNLILLKHYLPIFKAKGAKDIILIGSESSLQGAKQGAVYCATKFAIRGLAQSLRADCANADIRVILVNPGPVSTEFFDDLNFEPKPGKEFVIEPESVADSIYHAIQQPRNVVIDEVNIQPIKRSFSKK